MAERRKPTDAVIIGYGWTGAIMAKALTDAGVEHVVETYPAKHGWVLSDAPSYDAACCERHWRELRALYADTLTPS